MRPSLSSKSDSGSPERGKRGDFIVLGCHIFALDPFELHGTRVLLTYLDGHQVYAAE